MSPSDSLYALSVKLRLILIFTVTDQAMETSPDA
jgi:hypothetical protein